MNVILKRDIDGVDWEAVASVYEQTLGREDPQQLQRTWEKSYATCLAYSDKLLIGAARAISDGEREAAIFGVVVLPQFQRQGVGTMMMKALLADFEEAAVLLTYGDENEGFYRKLGFRTHRTVMALNYPEKCLK